MNTILQSIPPIAGDCAGALQVLSSFPGLHFLYGPKGCLASIRAVQNMEPFVQNPILAFGMSEIDAVMGMEEKILEQVPELAKAYPAKGLLTLTGSPIPAVSGIDLRMLAKNIEERLDMPVIAVAASGFESCYYGMQQAWLALAERFLTPGNKRARCLNIMGASALSLGKSACLDELIGLIERCGLELGCIFDRCEDVAALQHSTEAAFNLVLGHEAIGLAGFFEKHFGIPYKVLYPAGCWGMQELIELLEDRFNITIPHCEKEYYTVEQHKKNSTRAALAAPPALAEGLRRCLHEEWGFGDIRVLAYMPEARKELRLWRGEFSADLVVSEDEQLIRQSFNDVDFIFADPVFSDFSGGSCFIPLVQPCISGQLFSEQGACLIGKAGHAYLAEHIT
ncbi:MAG TPA: nitrogenase component 1 [Clostridia bacterium]|nr:nitrogenase component 1 [Clostridia bacterium]